jgi:hypothetical protein
MSFRLRCSDRRYSEIEVALQKTGGRNLQNYWCCGTLNMHKTKEQALTINNVGVLPALPSDKGGGRFSSTAADLLHYVIELAM